MINDHTPGPWHAHPAIRAGEFVVTAESGGFAPLARVKGDKRSTLNSAHANARLMAAAPDLLDALLAMLDSCHDVERNEDVIAAVDLSIRAINKCVTVGESK